MVGEDEAGKGATRYATSTILMRPEEYLYTLAALLLLINAVRALVILIRKTF